MANCCSSETLKTHTNAHAVRGRPTLKDVERFRNGRIRELKEKCQKNTRETRNTKNTRKIKAKETQMNLKRTQMNLEVLRGIQKEEQMLTL